MTQFGYLSVLERSHHPIVTRLEWAPDPQGQRLTLHGSCTDPGARPAALLLRHNASGGSRTVPLAWEGSDFTAQFTPGRMPTMAGEVPLAPGSWDVLASTGEAVLVARSLLPDLPGYHPAGLLELELQAHRTDALRLAVRAALSDDERGPYAQRRLQLSDYPAAVGSQLRDMAVFSSFGGRQFSGNPRAIYAEMQRRNLDLDYVWVTDDGQFNEPVGARLLMQESRAHYEAMARARYVVCDDLLPPWFRKRDQQICLQTWRGTPLKHIGLDIERPQFTDGLIYPDLIRKDAADWDLLLSQNAFSTPIFRRCLRLPR